MSMNIYYIWYDYYYYYCCCISGSIAVKKVKSITIHPEYVSGKVINSKIINKKINLHMLHSCKSNIFNELYRLWDIFHPVLFFAYGKVVKRHFLNLHNANFYVVLIKISGFLQRDQNDLAIVEIVDEFDFSKPANVGPICLPPDNFAVYK